VSGRRAAAQRGLDLVKQDALRAGFRLAKLKSGDRRLRAANAPRKNVLRLVERAAKAECSRGVFHDPY